MIRVTIKIFKDSRSPHMHETLSIINRAKEVLERHVETIEIDIEKDPWKAIEETVLAIPTIDIDSIRIIGVPTVDEIVFSVNQLISSSEEVRV